MRNRPLVVVLALLAVGWTSTPSGQDPSADELRDLLKKLREERAGYYQRQRSRTDEIDKARAAIRKLDADLADLKARETEADLGLADVRGDVDKLREEEKAYEASRDKVLPALAAFEKEAKAFVESGPPYRVQDRLLRLTGPGATPAAPERLGRVWEFLQEELRVARSGEAFTADVPVDRDRVKPSRVVRVGHLFLAYVAEDGVESGLWIPGKGWTRAATPDQDRAIREALRMLDRHRAPGLLRLPVEGLK